MTDITAPEVLIALKVLRDYCKSLTKCTNAIEYMHNRSFVDMMDDPEIIGFGDWMFANGFNFALTAIECRIDEYIKTVAEIIDKLEKVSGDA